MIESSFQLAPGLGPARERALWRDGLVHWRDLASPSVRLTPSVERKLRSAVERADGAYRARDLERLCALLPSREHWRLYEAFAAEAVYLDIETSDDVVGFAGVSAIGFLDRKGPQLLLAGRDLHRFPELAADWPLLVTFNGLSFDVPVLRRAFPDWRPPACHIDLRHLLARLGHHGGLKSIERELSALHLARPAHLDGVGGFDAGWLFRRGRDGDRRALRLFAEYNLYDAVNLRTLMAYAYNQMVERETAELPRLRSATRTAQVPERGDVLYDVSKILLAL